MVWDGTRKAFDPGGSTALPCELLQAYSDQPKWVDLRWAREESGLGLDHPRFVDCVADLSAAIRGIAKDEIVGTQQQEQKKLLARRVAQQAELFVTQQVDLALLLAAAANDIDDNPDTRRALAFVLESTADLVAVLGTEGQVTSLSLDGSGQTLLVGTLHGSIELWEADHGIRRAESKHNSHAVTSLAFDSSGTLYVAGFADGSIVVSALAGRLLGRVQASGKPTRVAVHAQGPVVAAAVGVPGSGDVRVEYWELDSGRHVVPVSKANRFIVVQHLSFDEERKVLKVIESHGMISFDVQAGTELRQRRVPFYMRPGPKAYTPDGQRAAFTSFDGGDISFFEPDTWEDTGEEPSLHEGFRGVADGLGISPGVDAVAIVSNGQLKVIDPARARLTVECSGVPPGAVDVAISPAGSCAALRGEDRAQLHSPGRKTRLSRTVAAALELPSAIRGVVDAAFSPSGRLCAWIAIPDINSALDATGNPRRHPVGIWDCIDQGHRVSIPSGSAHQIVFDNDDSVAVLDLEAGVSSWSAITGERLASGEQLPRDWGTPHVLRLWCPEGHDPVVLAVQPDGTAALHAPWGKSSRIGWQSPPPTRERVIGIATSRSTRFALSYADGRVEIWDLDGTLVQELAFPRPTATVALSGDGRLLLAVSMGTHVVVRDLDAGTMRLELLLPGPVRVTLAETGETLFTLDSTGCIRAFDVATGILTVQLRAAAPASTLVVGPDPAWLAEIAMGGGLRLWNLDAQTWRDLARSIAARALTSTESALFHLS